LRGDITSLAEIAKSQPHAAYIALTKAYKSKFTYFMRTIEAFEDQGRPTQMIFKEHENEKKRKYQQGVLVVEMGSFTLNYTPCFRY
jgi:hypothetical protein